MTVETLSDISQAAHKRLCALSVTIYSAAVLEVFFLNITRLTLIATPLFTNMIPFELIIIL